MNNASASDSSCRIDQLFQRNGVAVDKGIEMITSQHWNSFHRVTNLAISGCGEEDGLAGEPAVTSGYRFRHCHTEDGSISDN